MIRVGNFLTEQEKSQITPDIFAVTRYLVSSRFLVFATFPHQADTNYNERLPGVKTSYI